MTDKIEFEEPQKIVIAGVAHAILPWAQYQRLRTIAEDAADLSALRRGFAEAEAAGYVPDDVVSRLIAGESPVRVYREWRGLTGKALADKAGLSQAYVSGIETGKRRGSVRALKALAAALAVDLDDLV